MDETDVEGVVCCVRLDAIAFVRCDTHTGFAVDRACLVRNTQLAIVSSTHIGQ